MSNPACIFNLCKVFIKQVHFHSVLWYNRYIIFLQIRTYYDCRDPRSDHNRDLKTFIRFPLSLYKNNPYYVPSLYEDEMNTLRKDRNPAFATAQAHYWLAYRGEEIVGRVAALHVTGDELKWGNKYVRFGWLISSTMLRWCAP
jgi:hypothetical protein